MWLCEVLESCVSTNLALNLSLLLPDIVLYLCEKEHIEGGMIFQLLEDLTEMSTMRNCKDIFGYIESKQDVLGKVHAYIYMHFLIVIISLLFFYYLQIWFSYTWYINHHHIAYS